MNRRHVPAPATHTITVRHGKTTLELSVGDIVDQYLRRLRDDDTWQQPFTSDEVGTWLAAVGVYLRHRANENGIDLAREYKRVRSMLMAGRIELDE